MGWRGPSLLLLLEDDMVPLLEVLEVLFEVACDEGGREFRSGIVRGARRTTPSSPAQVVVVGLPKGCWCGADSETVDVGSYWLVPVGARDV